MTRDCEIGEILFQIERLSLCLQHGSGIVFFINLLTIYNLL